MPFKLTHGNTLLFQANTPKLPHQRPLTSIKQNYLLQKRPLSFTQENKYVHLLIKYPNIAYWINTQPTHQQIIVQNIKNRAIYLKNNHPINIKYQAFKPTPTHIKKSMPFSDDPNPIKSLFSQPFQATMHKQLLTVWWTSQFCLKPACVSTAQAAGIRLPNKSNLNSE